MVLIGLLVVAAVLVILGVVLANVPLLIVSLVASLAAAGLMIRTYLQSRASSSGAAEPPTDPDSATPSDDQVASAPQSRSNLPVGSVSNESSSPMSQPVSTQPAAAVQAAAIGASSPPTVRPDADSLASAPTVSISKQELAQVDKRVWVADGYPEYHVEGCVELAGLSSEPVPYDQAVEDGFQPCVVCTPDAATAAAAPADTTAPADATSTDHAATTASDHAGQVWVVDGSPDYHLQGCSRLVGLAAEPIPHDQAVGDGFAECATCTPESADQAQPAVAAAATATDGRETVRLPASAVAASTPPVETPAGAVALDSSAPAASDHDGDVWVVDGRPEYHRHECSQLAGTSSEPIPHDQAVEDGFSECQVCRPEAAHAPAVAPVAAGMNGAASPSGSSEVWVVDGQPEYHLQACSQLTGQESLSIPHDQAVEDGFAECQVCRPESAATADVPATTDPERVATKGTGATGGEVWVVDGLPDFHRQECSTIAGMSSEAIPHDQAVEDGFTECSTCTPEAAHAPATAPPASTEPASAESPAETPVETPAEPASTAADVWVVDGLPDYHRHECSAITGMDALQIPHDQAVESGFNECSVCTPEAAQAPVAAAPDESPAANTTQVWVVDGFPDYHRQECSVIESMNSMSIPHDEAVESGFAECSTCLPEAAEASATQSGGAAAAAEEPAAEAVVAEPVADEAAPAQSSGSSASAAEVWVVDGLPDYHREQCSVIEGMSTIAIPHDEAVESGFAECSTCTPEAAEAATPVETQPAQPAAAQPDATEPAESTTTTEVWVVDGFPDYHRQQCSVIEGMSTIAIPHDEAVESGFAECSTCLPEAAQAPTEPATDEPATDEAATDEAATDEPTSDEAASDEAAAEPETVDEPQAQPAGETAVAQVWVIDGYPDYHRDGCSELEGKNAEAVPHDQAVEDGFAECSVCTPESADSPNETAPESENAVVPPAVAADRSADAPPPPLSAEEYEPGPDAVPAAEPHDEPAAAESAAPVVAEPVPWEPEPYTPPAAAEPEAAEPEAAEAEPAADAPAAPAVPEPVPWEPEPYEPPAAAEPAAAEEPEAAEPAAEEPEAAQPAAEEPAAEEPAAEEPAAEEPTAEEPTAPAVPEPVPWEPEPYTLPAAAESQPAAEPDTAEPDTAEPETAEPTTSADQVYVIDGRPRFHAQDCLIIKGQGASPMTRDEAVADGFKPCSLCQRERV